MVAAESAVEPAPLPTQRPAGTKAGDVPEVPPLPPQACFLEATLHIKGGAGRTLPQSTPVPVCREQWHKGKIPCIGDKAHTKYPSRLLLDRIIEITP